MKLRIRIIAFLMLVCQSMLLADHTLPRHRAYTWSQLSLDDLKGEIRIPVLFINFEESNNDNERLVSANNQNTWMTRLNDTNTANHMGDDGSVNDYYLAQSYGQTDVTFENIGEYTATGKAADYADNSASPSMLRKALASLTDVDWSRYDSNGDKEVDCLLAIYAGHCDGDETSRGVIVTSIYPHQNWMSNTGNRKRQDVGAEGYFVQSYVLANDLRNHSTSVAAISTVCHELAHGIFDLPDYYKSLTSYMGQYDAMCYGYRQMTYGAATDHCCDMTSFNRMYLGWLTPRELTEPCHVRLEPLSKSQDACIIFDPQDNNHFFMLENRATLSNTWDAHLPAGGLVLTEINWRQNAFDSHTVNASQPKNIRVINAATSKGLAISNDTYYNFDQTQIPYGIKNRTEIPSAVNKIFETQTVKNITINDDQSIEFDFMRGATGIEAVGSIGVHADGEEGYDLLGRKAAPGQKGIVISNRKIKIIY